MIQIDAIGAEAQAYSPHHDRAFLRNSRQSLLIDVEDHEERRFGQSAPVTRSGALRRYGDA